MHVNSANNNPTIISTYYRELKSSLLKKITHYTYYIMSLCNFCNKEATYYFICPKCEKRFCNEHRKPEDHHCTSNQIPLENSEKEIAPSFPVITDNRVHRPEYELDDYVNLDEIIFTEKIIPAPRKLYSIKIPLTIMLIGTLLSCVFIGILSDPSEDTDNLKQIFDAIFEFYTELQADNYDHYPMDENTTLGNNSFQNESAHPVTTIDQQI